MRKYTKILAVILSVVMLLGVCQMVMAAEAAPEYTLIYSTQDSESDVKSELIREYAEKVKEVTDGRVEIEIHYNGELAATPEVPAALLAGTIDMGFVATTIDAAFQLDVLSEMIPCDTECQHPSRVYTKCLEFEDFAKPYEPFKVIALFAMGPNVCCTAKKEIATPDDLKGLTMGVCSGLQATMLGNMGVSAVFCEPNGEYTALEKGVVDGCFYLPWNGMVTQSWAEQLDYILMMNTTVSRNGFLMSKAAWDMLPQDIQEAMDGIQDWFVDEIDRLHYEDFAEKIKTVKEEYGVTYIYPTEEAIAEFQKYKDEAAQGYIEELNGQGIDATGFWEFYNKLIEENSGDKFIDMGSLSDYVVE